MGKHQRCVWSKKDTYHFNVYQRIKWVCIQSFTGHDYLHTFKIHQWIWVSILGFVIFKYANLLNSVRYLFIFKICSILNFSVGGSIPIVWAYFGEFQPKSKRGMMLCCLATFWMIGNVTVAGILRLFCTDMNYRFNKNIIFTFLETY